ncbi:MAG TPA: hypothetical protein VMW53_02865, partial [archaeon]|nr:hypothetical protein [archaeon]
DGEPQFPVGFAAEQAPCFRPHAYLDLELAISKGIGCRTCGARTACTGMRAWNRHDRLRNST